MTYNNFYTASYRVSIKTDPPGFSSYGNNNTVEYLMGSDLNLTCLVTPIAPADSEFSWNCSTGCFADMRMEQTINISNLTTLDSGLVTCSITVNDLDYHSDPLDLQVTGQLTFNIVHNIIYIRM